MVDLPLALLAAFCIGLSKTGFSGISLVAVFLLAELFGAKESVGIALPMLILADFLVYPSFHKHGSWKEVWPLLPPALAGVALGALLLNAIDNQIAGKLIGSIIAIMLASQLFKKRRPDTFARLAGSKSFALSCALFGGIATALANAAGPIISLYLLSRNFLKLDLLGIGVRFFLLINLIKVPLLAIIPSPRSGAAGLINGETLWINLQLAPAILVGVVLGRWLIGKVPQAVFEWMILAFASLGAFKLLFF
ncbi:MAG: sulfite exporter TauE/SafE family protein [Verrucomicrobiota bacterium]